MLTTLLLLITTAFADPSMFVTWGQNASREHFADLYAGRDYSVAVDCSLATGMSSKSYVVCAYTLILDNVVSEGHVSCEPARSSKSLPVCK